MQEERGGDSGREERTMRGKGRKRVKEGWEYFPLLTKYLDYFTLKLTMYVC